MRMCSCSERSRRASTSAAPAADARSRWQAAALSAQRMAGSSAEALSAPAAPPVRSCACSVSMAPRAVAAQPLGMCMHLQHQLNASSHSPAATSKTQCCATCACTHVVGSGKESRPAECYTTICLRQGARRVGSHPLRPAHLQDTMQHHMHFLASHLETALAGVFSYPTPRWPVYVFCAGAMTCLLFSSLCHLLGCCQVRVCARVRACVLVHACVCMHVFACVCACMGECCMCMCVDMCVCVRACTCQCACMCVRMYRCMHM